MSEFPPALPPESQPVPPAPPEGAAAETAAAQPAYPWPPPAPSLAYSLPTTAAARVQRPAVITALGVASIAVALLSAVGAVLTVVAAFLFFAGAQAMSTAASAAQNSSAAPVAPRQVARPAPETGQNGVADPVRRGVVEAFYALHPMRPPRIEQLNAILAREGKTILLTPDERKAGASPAPERVRGLVEDHGELYSRNLAAAPDYFRLSTGRLELYDDRAVFYPADGSATIRNSFGRTPGRRALTGDEAAAVVRRAKELAAGALNDAQAAALTSALTAADQKFVSTSAAAGGAGGPTAPTAVIPGAGDAITIRFADADLYLGPKGEVLGAPPGPAPAPKPSTAAFLAVLAASLVGLALAVVLFIAAVLFLRGLPSGRRLHLTWAWIKIPVAAASSVAFWWMVSSFYEAITRYDPGAPARVTGGARSLMAEPWQPVAVAVVAQVYPVVVIAMMRTRAVREYMNPTE
jgi:hypothetical protein